ncbi:serine/threonine-protein kinase PEPKR2-like isoform X2 [Durio zibethinus]|uniref:Serine/threonine-protein kinase PEPKR2-like isoform X2 n=1 Tax=Durio zibethinus TaxID=66656 RepID=A0A6P6AFT5_DURZI|nr:serine/threonine-protein kinase PEPKR2-like isoform X2 [Durio zibethinus]
MEALRKKRKGLEVLPSCRRSFTPVTVVWSHLSLKDYSRQKKKCKEDEIKVAVGSVMSVVKGIATAPPCGSASLEPPNRGIKRKIGCIDAATQFGCKTNIEQDYDLGATIGSGKFGSVVLCRSKVNGEEFACKVLRKGEELVHQEVEIMQHLSGHPGIVTLKAVYEDLKSFFLVMELCSGGRLLDQMAKQRRYSEYCAANILKELVLVIKYCHDIGVVHRDIKPENILLTASGQMKLADFGLAVRMSNGQSLTGVVGSPAYAAPEVLMGNYSEKVDVWSAGVLLHALLVSVLPFQGDTLHSVFEAIKNVDLDFENGTWRSISQPARDLVAHMLTRDVSARLTADEVLRHPWILFHTEATLEMVAFKTKMRNHGRLTSQQLTVSPGVVSKRRKIIPSGFLNDDSFQFLSSDSSSTRPEVQDSVLVDALTVSISRVRISEPKRTRLCGPTGPVQQECSSNIKGNNLCTAF